ncbi:MAG: hypothetical protein ACRDY2_09260 [Acidimicrobiales bacterium]
MTTREILEAVAAGRITPEEAAARLAAGSEGVGLRRVRVRAATRTVRVLGDPGVSEVAVEGLHEVRREGDTLVVSAHPAEGGGGFAFVPPDLGRLVSEGKARARQAAQQAAREAARMAYAAGRPAWAPPPGRGRHRNDWKREWKRDWKGEWTQDSERAEWQGWPEWPRRPEWRDFVGGPGGSGAPNRAGEFGHWVEPLVIRVNPRLAVDADVSAGSLEVRGVKGAVGVDLAFASATLEGVSGPLDVRAQAATVRVRAALTEGTSRIRGDAVALYVALQQASDVTVHARCDLGRLRMSRGDEVLAPGESLVVGTGRASLDIEASMGSVEVRVEDGGRS